MRKTLDAGEGFLITSRESVRYLSGFTGTVGTIFISADRAVFLTDFRYLSQSEEEVSGMERKVYAKRLEALAETAADSGISRLKYVPSDVSINSGPVERSGRTSRSCQRKVAG